MAAERYSFTQAEIRPVLVVSFISALRLLGIFLMLPIFSAYAVHYPGATITLAGIAFGIYALTQCLFQIPLGWASDRWGRRPVLVAGLLLFSLGSLGCAFANDIYTLILARALQGSGAVGSVALAALADITRPTVRAQAYTVIGIGVGLSFVIGLLAGPLLATIIGLSGLFYILTILAFSAMLLASLSFPETPRIVQDAAPLALTPMVLRSDLRPIFVATFVLSFTLNLFFFTYPLSWTEAGLERDHLWKVYLIIFLPSVFVVFPYMRHLEKRGLLGLPMRLGWLTATGGYAIYWLNSQYGFLLYLSGAAFFFGYSLFQPLLPTFLTQRIVPHGRGTAAGLYTFFGFVGSSLGGIVAGALLPISPSLPEFVGVTVLVLWYFLGLPDPPDSAT